MAEKKKGFFARLFNGFSEVDDDFYDEIEEQLILGDIGVYAAEELVEHLRSEVKSSKIKTQEDARKLIMDDIKAIMAQPEDAYDFENRPSVMLVIGVNGVGKTTCIGKLANLYKQLGKKVILAGADTFRAAAADQLKIWAERNDCYMISGNEGADPGSVVFDACKAVQSRGADILICDTAGRLHNKKNLMNELAKLDKIINGELSGYSKQNIIVLDSTTGQNALNQAREFKDVMNIDGIILTKLDGTAKGGIAVAITRELGVPVKYIGVGEGINDLERFDPDKYVENLFAE
ncbi:MAG: signal recognition particle-docking protein FtsY [Parasporobacterium sp.]|nr:signal recognition particle-docking protein FtsY [Parasporobacterium sp.]